jgi:NADH-quinone oxidoreductase subunit I
MVVVKTSIGSELKRHLEVIKAVASEIINPSTMTISYPKEERVYENLRGLIELNLKACWSCYRCARICPVNAIIMKKIGKKYYPSIDYGKCIFCHFCVDVCPTGALENTKITDIVFNEPDIILNPDEKIKYEFTRKKVKYEFDKDIRRVITDAGV